MARELQSLNIADSMPSRPRTFRIFKQSEARKTGKFVAKLAEQERLIDVRLWTSNEGEHFLGVNYYGNPTRKRVSLAKAKVIMWHGNITAITQ